MDIDKRKINKENNIPSQTKWNKITITGGFYKGLTGFIEGKISKKDKHRVTFNSSTNNPSGNKVYHDDVMIYYLK